MFRYMKLIILLLIIALFPSCSSVKNSFSCPYELSSIELIHEEKESERELKNEEKKMTFSFYNYSNKTVTSFVLAFMIFDSEGNNPFDFSNSFVLEVQCDISGGESDDFFLDLARLLPEEKEDEYLLDSVFIRKIVYKDSSSWEDPFGMYCIKEDFE